jgi:hypothetical protein
MAATLTVRDETFDGRDAHEWSLDIAEEHLTVRELIRSRVYQEVQDYNTRRPHTWRGLVQPSAEERQLNAPGGSRPFKPVDWKRQFDLACEAFETGRVLILVGDTQADALDEEFAVRPGTAVTFVRLTPLVGG